MAPAPFRSALLPAMNLSVPIGAVVVDIVETGVVVVLAAVVEVVRVLVVLDVVVPEVPPPQAVMTRDSSKNKITVKVHF